MARGLMKGPVAVVPRSGVIMPWVGVRVPKFGSISFIMRPTSIFLYGLSRNIYARKLASSRLIEMGGEIITFTNGF